MPMTDQHLPAATLAAYVDRALDAGARTAADRHLAVCAACRAELVALSNLVVDLPSAQRGRNWRVAVGALAAAGIVGLVLVSPTRAPTPSSATERTTAPSAATIEILQPAENGTATVRDGSIVWRSVEPRATYRVTVTDTAGATRWTAETSDTTVVVPPSARLEAGARFYLYVDAQRADGWSLQSGPRAFRTSP